MKTAKSKQETPQPIGVIQSLSSGFDLVTRHPDLMLMPILLDLFLWLGPRLSAYPLFRALIDFFNSPDMLAAMTPTQSQQMDAMRQLLDEVGQAFNLFWWLSPMLLGVPGVMVGSPVQKLPNGAPAVWPVSSGLMYVVFFVAFSLIGLGLAASYWAMLSSRVREQAVSLGRFLAMWWGLVKIAVLLTLLVFIIGMPTMMAMTLVGLFSPFLAQLVVMMGASLLLWAVFYLVFTVHGVALRDAQVIPSLWASIRLMRAKFVPTMGLIIAAVGIYIGMGFVWNIPANDSWIKAAGILGNAFTGTGLLAATAIYYLERTAAPESK